MRLSKAIRLDDGTEDATAAMQALMALASVASEANVPDAEDEDEAIEKGDENHAKQSKELVAMAEDALACKEETLEEEPSAERQMSEASEEPATTGELAGLQGVESQLSAASTCRRVAAADGLSPSGSASKLDDFQQKLVLTLRRAMANKKAERAHVLARISELHQLHVAAVKFVQGLSFPEDRELEVAVRMVAQRKVEEYAARKTECEAALHEIEMWADTWLRSAEGPSSAAASMARLYKS
jgi:hypothetical protein